MSAMYSLGAIVSLPFVPPVTDYLGRRMAIIFGSVLMVIGAALQTAAQNCKWTSVPFVYECGKLTLSIQLQCSSLLDSSLVWVFHLLSLLHHP